MTTHILALETSSSLCGVALLTSTAEDFSIRALEHDATAEHAERLLPMVDALLAEAGLRASQLDAIAFGQGPGGFTGLRVACGVAQGMAFGLDIPVVPVPSLMAVAADAPARAGAPSLKVVVQDARMGEVYLAAYESDRHAASDAWGEFQPPILLNAAHVGAWLDAAASDWMAEAGSRAVVCLVGDALQAYPDLAHVREGRDWTMLGPVLRPDVRTIARLALQMWRGGGGIAPELAAPLYVRDKVAFTTHERRHGAGGNPKAPELPVQYVQMLEEHLDDVASIEQSVQSFPWTRGNFADGLQAGYSAWVARQAGRTIGFCMTMLAPDVAHVLVIAVSPDSQKKGVGAELLRICEREAASRGLPAVVLEVRPSNKNALAFYRHQGFSLLAMRKDYYPAADGVREDACVMQKRLEIGPREQP